jgi:hypothetical protein
MALAASPALAAKKKPFTPKKVHLTSPAYGAFRVKYVDKTHKLTGSGGNPSCAPGVNWTLDGKLTHAAFTGTISIKLANGQTANSSLSANRQ